MSDLPVVAVIVAKPGSEEVVRDGLTALVAPTRAEEGCVSYDLYESQTEPGTFVTVEAWRSPADLDAHFASPHVTQVLTLAEEHLASPPSVHPLGVVG